MKCQTISGRDHRFYRINGEFYPSVTTILQVYPKGLGFAKWLVSNGSWNEAEKVKEEAGDRGSKVHNAIVQIIKGRQLRLLNAKKEKVFSDEEWKALLGFRNFWEDYRPVTLESEKIVYSKKFGFAGTVDWIGSIEMPDKNKKKTKCLAMLDWKTSKGIYNSYLLQVSAYCYANAEMKGRPVEALAVVQLGSKAKRVYSVKLVDDRKLCFKTFLACKAIWDFENPQASPSLEKLPGTIKIQKYAKVQTHNK